MHVCIRYTYVGSSYQKEDSGDRLVFSVVSFHHQEAGKFWEEEGGFKYCEVVTQSTCVTTSQYVLDINRHYYLSGKPLKEFEPALAVAKERVDFVEKLFEISTKVKYTTLDTFKGPKYATQEVNFSV